MQSRAIWVTIGLLAILADGGVWQAVAEGHGPAFGLAPPTLGKGLIQSDTMVQSFSTTEDTQVGLRQMVGYGFNEDLQGTLSFPLSPTLNELDRPPRTRMGSMTFGSAGDLEGTILWRPHKQTPGGGKRFETTVMLGGTVPLDRKRGGLEVGPSLGGAAVTGYASRNLYAWVGGGFHHYYREGGDRIGDLPFATAVFGYRPEMFQWDYPAPDWRIFLESVAEFPQRHERNGRSLRNTGGNKVLVGPSVLGLYGQWGVGAGVLFPVHQDLNGSQPREKVRAKAVFTYWF